MEFISRSQAAKQVGVSYLGSINSSAKIQKNGKVSNNYTYVLYLAPHNTSGYPVCPYSTPECRKGCLYASGRVKIERYSGKKIIENARIKKTCLFFEENNFFMKWMITEMKSYQAKAKRDGYYFSVRLNGTSDIQWEDKYFEGKNIMQHFPDVQFYDYTKNPERMLTETMPENYHLTFSYTGRNLKSAIKVLERGKNVAVVFDTADFPETWNGYPVINGDLTDYRPYDGNGVVVGLKYKELADKQINEEVKNSCFVVKTNVPELELA